ncbi:hypothetical protein FF36_05317 [Frankia torreyi]|uniref:Uncharacterized protein n=1 Tax=Frankia torreyi TaxID=1856 RepID=A0A0D8B7U6_9ACTN|nr:MULTISPECIES: hypothetical protein [Frankia]KJE20343.1 hypothetical protein FF36_05317 [Frankia torreyi]KQM02753.1 hypothetical protein FF86_105745 [Frankia sp. CpI1-P]
MGKKKISGSPTDAVEAVQALGGLISPDMATCVICGPSCRCAEVEFGSDEYFARLDRVHGRTDTASGGR